MAQDVDSPSNITVLEHELEFLHDFVYRYFGSTISDTLTLESELNSASARLPLPLPAWPREYGPTRSWRKVPKSRSTEPMFWARCCTGACPWPNLLTVREGLSFPNWSFQPHKSLFENNQSERDITVFRDCRMPMKWKEIDDLIEARMFKTKIIEKTKCKQGIIL